MTYRESNQSVTKRRSAMKENHIATVDDHVAFRHGRELASLVHAVPVLDEYSHLRDYMDEA